MVPLAKLWPMVLVGVCILLGGCGGHGGDTPPPPKPALPATTSAPLPTAPAGDNGNADGSKRALHRQGAAYRREQASHKSAPQ